MLGLGLWPRALVRCAEQADCRVNIFGGGVLRMRTELSLVQNHPPPLNRISRLYDQQIIRAGEPVELTGTITGQPEPAPQSFYLTLDAERIRIKGIESGAAGTVLLTARLSSNQLKNEYDALELRHGARLRLLATHGP